MSTPRKGTSKGGAARTPRAGAAPRAPKKQLAEVDSPGLMVSATEKVSGLVSAQSLQQTLDELLVRMSKIEGTTGISSLAQKLGQILVEKDVKVPEWIREQDRNGDGVISKLEFRVNLRKLLSGASMTLEVRDIDGLFAELDHDGDGKLDLPNVKAALKKLQDECRGAKARVARMQEHLGELSKVVNTYREAVADATALEAGRERLNSMKTDIPPAAQLGTLLAKRNIKIGDVARKWDSDGSGTIDSKEWRRHVKGLGFAGTDGDCDAIFDFLDDDDSGELDLEELKVALKRLQEASIEADAALVEQESEIANMKKKAKASQKTAAQAKENADVKTAEIEAAEAAAAAEKAAVKAAKAEAVKEKKRIEAEKLEAYRSQRNADLEDNHMSSLSDLADSQGPRFTYRTAEVPASTPISAAAMAYEARGKAYLDYVNNSEDGWLRSQYEQFMVSAERRAHYVQQRRLQSMAREQVQSDRAAYLQRGREKAHDALKRRHEKEEEIKALKNKKTEAILAMKAEATERATRAQENARQWAEHAAQRVAEVKLRGRMGARHDLELARARAAAAMRVEQKQAIKQVREEYHAKQRAERDAQHRGAPGSSGQAAGGATRAMSAEELSAAEGSAKEAEEAREKARERARTAKKKEEERKAEASKSAPQIKNLTQLAQEEKASKLAAQKERLRLAAEAEAKRAAEEIAAAAAAEAEAAAAAKAAAAEAAAAAAAEAEAEKQERKARLRREKLETQKQLVAAAMKKAAAASTSAASSPAKSSTSAASSPAKSSTSAASSPTKSIGSPVKPRGGGKADSPRTNKASG